MSDPQIAKTHYFMLLQELRDWKALDKFSAEEDVHYAQQRIQELQQEIAKMQKENSL